MDKKQTLSIFCAAYIIILFLGAITIKPSDISVLPGFDKLIHLGSFFILTILLLLTFERYKLNNNYIIGILIAIAIGIIIELVQLAVPGREFSLFDIAADFGGAVIASLLVWIYTKLAK
jgi:VanZ family protein